MLFDSLVRERSFHLVNAKGSVSFVLLFLQLRLVDDIADNESCISTRNLWYGVLATIIVLAILNNGGALALFAISSTALMLFTTFVLRPLLDSGTSNNPISTGVGWKDLVLAFAYEGTHFVMVAYLYIQWASASRRHLQLKEILQVITLFWIAFEFWKYSRGATRLGWSPYNLSWGRMRYALVALLTLSFAIQLTMLEGLLLGIGYKTYLIAVFCFFLYLCLWAFRNSADVKAGFLRRRMGVLFAMLQNVGLVFAALAGRAVPDF
jgi:hypothetical protein